MDEIKVDTSDRRGLAIGGILLLPFGLFFVVFGADLVMVGIRGLGEINSIRDVEIAFITLMMLIFGLLILSLCYQMFTGRVGTQHISTPLLILVSCGFIALSIVLAVASMFGNAPSGYRAGKAIGGSMVIGYFGLYFAYKRTRSKVSNNILTATDPNKEV